MKAAHSLLKFESHNYHDDELVNEEFETDEIVFEYESETEDDNVQQQILLQKNVNSP